MLADTPSSADMSETAPAIIRSGNLEIRPAEYQLLVEGRRVGLTVREFETFHVLAQRYDRVVPRPEIYRLVWGSQMAYRDRSVDVFVRKVRRKLAKASPEWTYIHTHFGIGYRFMPAPRAEAADSASVLRADDPPSR